MTTEIGTKGVPKRRYARVFLANLDNPEMIWKHAFENQLSDDSRCLLHILATMPDSAQLDAVQRAWVACLPQSRFQDLPGEVDLQFRRTLKQLDDSFVSIERIGSANSIGFHNASIRDFVARRIAVNRNLANDLIRKACYFEQVASLIRLQKDGKLSLESRGLIKDSDDVRAAIELHYRCKQSTCR